MRAARGDGGGVRGVCRRLADHRVVTRVVDHLGRRTARGRGGRALVGRLRLPDASSDEEGAAAVVRLERPAGEVVLEEGFDAPGAPEDDGELRTSIPPGAYRLRIGEEPCPGSCGGIDGYRLPAEHCTADLDLETGDEVRATALVAATGCAVAVADGMSGEVRRCESAGSPTDFSGGPDWVLSGSGYRPWATGEGCALRPDVIADLDLAEHCELQAARGIVLGNPPGTRSETALTTFQFLRDPKGVVGRPDLAAAFDPVAPLPVDAVDLGYRLDAAALWLASDTASIYLVGPDHTERWPRAAGPGEDHVGLCA